MERGGGEGPRRGHLRLVLTEERFIKDLIYSTVYKVFGFIALRGKRVLLPSTDWRFITDGDVLLLKVRFTTDRGEGGRGSYILTKKTLYRTEGQTCLTVR